MMGMIEDLPNGRHVIRGGIQLVKDGKCNEDLQKEILEKGLLILPKEFKKLGKLKVRTKKTKKRKTKKRGE